MAKTFQIPRSRNEMNLILEYIKYDVNEAKYKCIHCISSYIEPTKY